MKKKIKTGIIGAGRIGKIHTENIIHFIRDAEIKTVADVLVDNIKDWALGLGIKKISKDYKDIINDPEIDVVFICSPTNTHAQFIKEASKTGKHIFCEKPIDLNIDKVKEAIEVIDENGIKFQLGFNRRFDHNFKKVHDLIKEGKIGKINLIKITSWDPGPPPLDYLKVCGGIFLDMTIHDFDMARFLSESEILEVYTNAAVLVDPEIGKVCRDYDTAIISLKFANGAIGVIDNCRKASHGYDQRVEVLGSEGSIEILNDTPSTTIVSSDKGICYEKPLYFFLERYAGAYIEEIKAFYDAVINNKETPVKATDGLKAVELGIAALKSAQENRPVKIEEFR